MVYTFGNNIVSAFTNGVSVKEIYTNGVKVWPVSPTPEYYISWTPSNATGAFSIGGQSYRLEDYSGYFTDFDGYITTGAFSNNYSGITGIETNAIELGDEAFYTCRSLSTVSLSCCINIGYRAFAQCRSLSSVYIPNCEYIGPEAFYYCSSLSQVSLPNAHDINPSAFAHTGLTSVYLPVCSTARPGVFAYCSSLSQVSIPRCRQIGSNAFYNTGLTSIEFRVDTIGSNAFYGCSSLSQVSLPRAECFYQYAFANTGLTSVYLPSALEFESNVFANCSSLSVVDIMESAWTGTLDDTMFDHCSNLQSLYLRATNVVFISNVSNYSRPSLLAFSPSCKVYVPSDLVELYKSDIRWRWYSSRIYPIQ